MTPNLRSPLQDAQGTLANPGSDGASDSANTRPTCLGPRQGPGVLSICPIVR
jgi:hypothetical protein